MAKKSSKAEPAHQAAAGSFWSRYGVVLKAWALFLIYIALFHTGVQLTKWFGIPFPEWANRFNAELLAVLLQLVGAEGRAQGTLVTSSIFSAEIIFECTAVYPIGLLISAVLSYPCRWRTRLWGVLLGVPTMIVINQIRLLSLFYVGHWWEAAFETAHMVVWQSLIIFFTVMVWMLWVVTFVGRDEPSRA